MVLERLDRSDESFPHYQAALAGGIEKAQAHFRLAFLFARNSQPEKAIQHLEKALEKEAERYLPQIDQELLKIHSDLDAIRYTSAFAELLDKFRK